MARVITGYTFNPSAKTITFTDADIVAAGLMLKRVTKIAVVKQGKEVPLYLFGYPGLGGSVSGNVLTLTYDTTVGGLLAADELRIEYEDGIVAGAATSAAQSVSNAALGTPSDSAPATDTDPGTMIGWFRKLSVRIGSMTGLQTTGNSSLASADTNQGAKADAVATTDTGTFSLIALTKKIASNITSLLGTNTTGVSAPTGATGLMGWLSGMYDTLKTAGIKIASGNLNLTGGTLAITGTMEVTWSAGAPFSDNGTGTAAAAVIWSGEIANMCAISIQLKGTWVGLVIFEVSNDGVTYDAHELHFVKNGTVSAMVTNMAAVGMYEGNVAARYARLRVQTYTSGTVQASIFAKTAPYAPMSVGGTMVSRGTYASTKPSITSGGGADLQQNSWGALYTTRDATNATNGSIATSTGSTPVVAANTKRVELIATNNSTTNTMYLKYGNAAAPGSFTHKLGPGEKVTINNYVGVVEVAASAGTDNLVYTETYVL